MSGDVSVDATEQTPIIELKGSGRSYAEHVAVRAIDLAIFAGQLVAIVGDSRSGKTTR